MAIFFTSDLHFGHQNIVSWEKNREHYTSVEEMDRDMIRQWNELITNDDIVYFLGDFSLGLTKKEIIEVLHQLKFKELRVILGNHDNRDFRSAIKRFDNITEVWADRLKVDGFLLYLSHFPMDMGNRKKHFNLHAHLHSKPSPKPKYMLNVGYDSTGQIAISLDEVIGKVREMERSKKKKKDSI